LVRPEAAAVPSSVTAFAVPPSPQGEGLGTLSVICFANATSPKGRGKGGGGGGRGRPEGKVLGTMEGIGWEISIYKERMVWYK